MNNLFVNIRSNVYSNSRCTLSIMHVYVMHERVCALAAELLVPRCACLTLSLSVGIQVSHKALYERSLGTVIRAGPYQCHGQTGSLIHGAQPGTQGLV